MPQFSLDAKIGSYGPRRQNGPVDEPEIRRAIAAEALKQSNERFSPPIRYQLRNLIPS
jgi:hypothetical protein